jgi:hypothetical protein
MVLPDLLKRNNKKHFLRMVNIISVSANVFVPNNNLAKCYFDGKVRDNNAIYMHKLIDLILR